MKICSYYQAFVEPSLAWFFVGALRSFEHVCFDRTLNVKESTFEFFVPEEQEQLFLLLMHYFENEQIIKDLKKLPNRLEDAELLF
jgi:hypothetical protein